MNKKYYRLIFDKTKGIIKVVAEYTKSRSVSDSSKGKISSQISNNLLKTFFNLSNLYILKFGIFSSILLPLSTVILAQSILPSGGSIKVGSGSIGVNGKTMNINQLTNKLGIDWQSFSIGKGNTVNFIQPGAGSVALNRVIGNNRSEIYGAINANGKVFLVNQNGIIFGKSAEINAGSFVAVSYTHLTLPTNREV